MAEQFFDDTLGYELSRYTEFEADVGMEVLAIPNFEQGFIQDDNPSTYLSTSDLPADQPDLSFSIPSLEHPGQLPSFSRLSRSGKRTSFRKDFYRMQHIRALKKSIRQHKQRKFAATSIHKVDPQNPIHTSLWTKLMQLYLLHSEFFDSISSPSTVTEGGSAMDDSKTCNNTYLRSFFARSIVQVYNYVFTELVFAGDPARMCKKMKLECCMEGQHGEECREKWRLLKVFTRGEMIREVRGEVSEEVEREARKWLLKSGASGEQ